MQCQAKQGPFYKNMPARPRPQRTIRKCKEEIRPLKFIIIVVIMARQSTKSFSGQKEFTNQAQHQKWKIRIWLDAGSVKKKIFGQQRKICSAHTYTQKSTHCKPGSIERQLRSEDTCTEVSPSSAPSAPYYLASLFRVQLCAQKKAWLEMQTDWQWRKSINCWQREYRKKNIIFFTSFLLSINFIPSILVTGEHV